MAVAQLILVFPVIQDGPFDMGNYDSCERFRGDYDGDYAVEESSKQWTAEFCQTVCSNYQDVIARG